MYIQNWGCGYNKEMMSAVFVANVSPMSATIDVLSEKENIQMVCNEVRCRIVVDDCWTNGGADTLPNIKKKMQLLTSSAWSFYKRGMDSLLRGWREGRW